MMSASPGMTIELKPCRDHVFRIQIGNDLLSRFPSSRCICTDKGIFCAEKQDQPIPNTNVVANCKELGGWYMQNGCHLLADDNFSVLIFKKGQPILGENK